MVGICTDQNAFVRAPGKLSEVMDAMHEYFPKSLTENLGKLSGSLASCWLIPLPKPHFLLTAENTAIGIGV